MNKLTNSIFRSLYHENLENNFVFSPASYLEAVHNLSLCLTNNNLKELLEVLGVTEEKDLVNHIKEYKKTLELENFNTLLYAQEYGAALNQEVVGLIKELGSNLESLDFLSVDSVVCRVNSLVNEKTHGKINSLISRGDINEFTKFIILNCVYFKKDWLWEFNKHNKWTQEEIFYGTNKKEQQRIKYLKHQKYYHFYEDDVLDIVELPYKGSDICCYLFVPKNGLFEIVNNLEENYNKINLVKRDCDVNLTVPPFKTESTFDSLAALTKLAGAKSIFEWNKDWKLVDFDKLLPEAVMKVEKIIQKAYIDFTREGTEAAAATAFMIGSGCMMLNSTPPRIKYIRADKPFMYVLANSKQKNNPLFMGIVNNLE